MPGEEPPSSNDTDDATSATVFLGFPFFEDGQGLGLLYDPNLSVIVAEGKRIGDGDGSANTNLVIEIVVPVVSLLFLSCCGCVVVAVFLFARRKYLDSIRVNMVYFNLEDESDNSDTEDEIQAAL